MSAVDRYQYLLLMAGCLLVTLPLEFVFGARVWRQPRRLLFALVPTVILFAAWDIAAIAREHWSFNPRYVTGRQLPGSLPVEELTFFVVIPICGLLTLEAVRRILERTG
jgi:lycopene cyclase domain-containing protein